MFYPGIRVEKTSHLWNWSEAVPSCFLSFAVDRYSVFLQRIHSHRSLLITDLGVRQSNIRIDLKREGNNLWKNTTLPKDSIVVFSYWTQKNFTIKHSLRYVRGFCLVFWELRTLEDTSYEAIYLSPTHTKQHTYIHHYKSLVVFKLYFKRMVVIFELFLIFNMAVSNNILFI